MNKITLHGLIRNIQFSHYCNNIEFYKADLIIPREGTNKEDIITLKFKHFSCPYKENDIIDIVGNLRTYSQQLGDKSKVELYCFTYFDSPLDNTGKDKNDVLNLVELDGRICKINSVKKTKDGKDVVDFILANNLKYEDQSLNCYIPMVAWGKLAKQISQMKIGASLNVKGVIQSREYKKKISDTDFEIRIAYEVLVKELVDENKEEIIGENK